MPNSDISTNPDIPTGPDAGSNNTATSNRPAAPVRIEVQTLGVGGGHAPLPAERREQVAQFLFQHLEEYGDPIEDIQRCLDYAEKRGGTVFTAWDATAGDDGQLLGAGITNETGMGGFIPENILVYIAVDAAARGRGVGKALMQAMTDTLQGSVALHVEPQNPARKLYEKYGFTHKYLEMRLKR